MGINLKLLGKEKNKINKTNKTGTSWPAKIHDKKGWTHYLQTICITI
jgi:hypothetical protein